MPVLMSRQRMQAVVTDGVDKRPPGRKELDRTVIAATSRREIRDGT